MIDAMDVLKNKGTPAVPVPLPTNEAIYEVATDVGKRTLWVVFVLMVLASLGFYALAFRVPIQKRLFHIITAFITTFAAISYYAMAVGDGVYLNEIHVRQSQKHFPDTVQTIYREVYWARYVDWSLTTPLLLLDLALLAGLSGGNILVALVADVIMVLTGLFAALTNDSTHKWGYYAMGCLAYLVVIYQLAINGRAVAAAKDSKTGTFFAAIGGFTLLLWTIYPIIWGFADGSRNADVNTEIILYAILDVLAKAVFGYWLLFTHDLYSSGTSLDGFWAHGLGRDGAIRVGDDDEGA
jgi:bacteriorhodopsin